MTPQQAAATSIGQANPTAIGFFLAFVSLTLGITYWAARRTKTTSEFFAAGGGVSAVQNGFALAGDFMSAASFLGIAGLVSLSGFDGLIYSVGWLVGWPVVTFLIAEPLRNLGKYTFADVVAYRLRQTPVRLAAAVGTPIVCLYALTNPQHTPWQVPSRVLFHEVPCRDCLKSVCPQGHHACLRGVTPASVADAALSLLEQDARPAAASVAPRLAHRNHR